MHCAKSVQIRSFFWSVFSRIWTEYGDLLLIQSKYVQMRPRKNSVFGEVFCAVLSLWLYLLYVFGIPYHIIVYYSCLFFSKEGVDFKDF